MLKQVQHDGLSGNTLLRFPDRGACGCEEYLRAYGAVSEARDSIGRYLSFYNGKRPHSSLAAKTPDQTYFDNLPLAMAA